MTIIVAVPIPPLPRHRPSALSRTNTVDGYINEPTSSIFPPSMAASDTLEKLCWRFCFGTGVYLVGRVVGKEIQKRRETKGSYKTESAKQV